jgi:uncharacterized membrane protein YbhN (UPF0104 family)
MRRFRLVLQIAIVAAVLGFVLSVLFRNLGQVRAAVRDGELSLRPGYLAASYLCLAMQLVSSSLVWHYITIRLKAAISVRKAVVSWMLSLLGKNIPGRVFVLAGRVYMYAQYGVSAGRVTLGFALELACSLAAAMLLVFTCLLLTASPAGATVRRLQPLLAIGPMIIMVMLHPRLLERFVNLVLRRLGRNPTSLSLRYRDVLSLVGLSYVNWALLGMGFFLLTKAIVSVGWQHLPFIMGTFSFAMIIGFVAVFTPAGLGVREGVVLAALQTAIPAGVAAVVALAARVWATLGEAAAAGLAVLVDHLLPSGLMTQHSREPDSKIGG